MTKEKRFVFWIIACVFLITAGYLFVPYLINKWEESHPLSRPSGKMVKLDPGDYKVGDKIKAAFYDIKANGTIQFMGRKLTDGDQLIGIELYKNNHVTVSGSGSVSLYPASFDKLSQNKNGEYMIHHSGFYIAGEQFPAGKYTLHYLNSGKNKEQTHPLIQILPSFNKNSTLSKSMKPNQTISFTIKENSILQVDKTVFDESNDIDIFLKRD
ncbi:hypothetical protein [Sporolactobacillus sp. THM19-2]|uniref:hypothetical protein n=1 Tax=Sporolactobacillus sp. THM19-2 TaxID=2511171 RepID=UPI001021DA4F|nr:hypothetical protein [Sporolactobacillus sp. THM19-2]RYL87311.1 hypothetical protein EWH91_13075 [Sporolactobacillus sp. THM19-2]